MIWYIPRFDTSINLNVLLSSIEDVSYMPKKIGDIFLKSLHPTLYGFWCLEGWISQGSPLANTCSSLAEPDELKDVKLQPIVTIAANNPPTTSKLGAFTLYFGGSYYMEK